MAILSNIPVAISKGRTRLLVVFSPFFPFGDDRTLYRFSQDTPTIQIGCIHPVIKKQVLEKPNRFACPSCKMTMAVFKTPHPLVPDQPVFKNIKTGYTERRSGAFKVSRETLTPKPSPTRTVSGVTERTRAIEPADVRKYKNINGLLQ